MKIENIDKNMKQNTQIQEQNMCVHNIDDEPFEILGVRRDGDIYVRMDLDVAKTVSQSVYDLAKHTSGGRVRFLHEEKKTISGRSVSPPSRFRAALNVKGPT